MSDRQSEIVVLKEFLALPHRASAVLDKFAALPGAVRKSGGEKEGFVYIPGTRAVPISGSSARKSAA